jgi:membrane protein
MSLSIFLSIKAKLLLSFDFTFISYIMVWGLFFLLYKVSANTKVSTKSSLISSFVASTVWSLSKYLFVLYITYNKTYSTIYGSFSVVMFFLIWLYISWIIFLYGVKFCYLLNKQ